ncbi:MAG TPA: chloride channel protein [Acidimicrobiales bacterium]|nr:chloride channel protein [Acidimicrobiales bacterium]
MPNWRSVGRRVLAWASRRLAAASYLRRWLVLGAAIGAIAGCGAVLFYEALHLATHLLLASLGGFTPSTPAGEGGVAGSTGFVRPWAVPLVVGGGALLSGILVFRFAPEAEGHGTDAAIAAVHQNPRGIRFRAVVVKIVASAITIGSGGSGGREGPTGQISAGFGSLLARALDLGPADSRVAVASGIGAGIGSIFSAPLGGAVLAAEILYREDFDPTVLVPSLISSIVGFSIFGAVEGYTPVFGFVSGYRFVHPLQLVWFALLGIVGGLVGLAYAKGFYGISSLFARMNVPLIVKPAIGGLLVGLMGLELPGVLGTGYGWVQHALGRQLLDLPLWVVLVLPIARIVATGLSIGSGGSGGIFGPGMVIGAFVGASVWRLLEPIAPGVGNDPVPFVVIGMMCCFGAIARAPLAVLLMVAEMTGNLVIVAPAMVAVGIATLIVSRNDDTIYRSQPKSRADTAASRLAVGLPLLASVVVADAAPRPRLVLDRSEPVGDAAQAMSHAGVEGAPVVDEEGRFAGTVSVTRCAELDPSLPIARCIDSTAPTVHVTERLDAALEALASSGDHWVSVVDAERRVVGTLAVPDLVTAYRRALTTGLRRIGELGRSETRGPFEIVVAPGSRLDGVALRDGALPRGLVVTTLERDGEAVAPGGSTVLVAGDRLTVIGSATALGALEDAVA